MSRKEYTDAQKAKYWKKRALQGGAGARSYAPAKNKYSAKYVANDTARYEAKQKWAAANRAEKREATKDPGVISSIGSALGGMAGSAFGGPAGIAVGNLLGGKIGHLIEKITGFGDYRIQTNSIMKGGMSPPYVVNAMNRGSVIIRHREFICDIKATTAFTVQTFPINPGWSNTFPWLSQIASSFEQYRMRGCLFEFLSTSSDALLSSATSTALGTVNMATQYDVAHPAFPDKRSMLNHEFSNSSKPSLTFIHPIECKKSRTPITELYTRSGVVPSGSDPHLYDLGNFQIATEGMQAAGGVLGELWVTYEVELFKQQFQIDSFTDHWMIDGATSGAWLGPGATTHVLAEGSSIFGRIDDAGSTYYFPPAYSSGSYLCTYVCYGTAATLGQISLNLVNCAFVDVLHSAASNFVQAPGNGTAATGIICQWVVKLSAPDALMQFQNAAIPTAGKSDLWVTRIADGIGSA